jgi:hypothetical protein
MFEGVSSGIIWAMVTPTTSSHGEQSILASRNYLSPFCPGILIMRPLLFVVLSANTLILPIYPEVTPPAAPGIGGFFMNFLAKCCCWYFVVSLSLM